MTSDPSQSAVLPGPVPGVVLVFAEGQPLCGAIPIRDKVELGRGTTGDVVIADPHISRQHVEIERADGAVVIRDLGSRSGFVLDGTAIASRGEARVTDEAVLVLGSSLFLIVGDVKPFHKHGLKTLADAIIGPRLAAVYKQIAIAATTGDTLHITGESGTGKELAAREFHRVGPRPAGPFVAVNSAALNSIFEDLVQEANNGTLFVDEIGELDATTQAKLLRILESRQVIPVHASRPVDVDIRFVSATHRDLRTMVGTKAFREDLFYRLGRPHVSLPPLRARREEIPAHIRAAADRVQTGISLTTALVEECMRRPWPGNIRELLLEVQDAASRGFAESASCTIDARHLDATAGNAFPDAARDPSASYPTPAQMPAREHVERALRDAGGQVVPAARALGVHRNQLRRWLARNQIDPRTFGGKAPAG